MAGFYIGSHSLDCISQKDPLLKRGDNEVRLKSGSFHVLHTGGENQRAGLVPPIHTVGLLDGALYGNVTGAASLVALYEAYGIESLKELDGDYAFCLYDSHNQRLIFSSDIFGTKPLWYSLGNQWGVASYEGILKRMECRSVCKALPNTLYRYDICNRTLESWTIYRFSTRQYKADYTDWIRAFDMAVRKRVKGRVVLGVSSGYDSGAILCSLTVQNLPFHAYTFTARENREILNRRREWGADFQEIVVSEQQFLLELRKLVRYCESYCMDGYDILSDESCVGLSLICQKAAAAGSKQLLSGLGADEILSDYGFRGKKINGLSQFGGLFPEDLTTLFPWTNFFGGALKAYLAKEEYVSGMVGVEMRYPFLDRAVVQEFLFLTCDLKNRWYKAPVHAYFTAHRFPFKEEKIGFFLR